MANTAKTGRELALTMLRALPRVSVYNIKSDFDVIKKKHGRGIHRGKRHGAKQKGSKQRQNYMRLGYETGNNPFYLRTSREPYYTGFHLRKQYPPLSLGQLQDFIDLNRLDTSKPIDLISLINTGLYYIRPLWKHYGVHLTDEGADEFRHKINIEVQWASEPVIAAIERNGGVITTAFYDMNSIFAMVDPVKFFQRGEPIPRRMLPSRDVIEYYSNPLNRGYLADPEQISHERLALAQKFGYELPKIEDDEFYSVLKMRKDPRQIFYGLSPGWVVSLRDKKILKPKDNYLKEFYAN